MENKLEHTEVGWYACQLGKEAFTQEELCDHGKIDLIQRFNIPSFESLRVKGAIYGLVHIHKTSSTSTNPWAMPGFVHWEIDQVLPLAKPIVCRGQKDVWQVPVSVLKLMAEQLM